MNMFDIDSTVFRDPEWQYLQH